MTTLPAVQMTEQGLFLPRQLFQNLGEIEVVHHENYVLIKPKNMTARFKGFVRPRVAAEALHDDYEQSLLEGTGS